MKTAILFLILVYMVVAIPYRDQLALANSVAIGRRTKEEVLAWDCSICTQQNQPLRIDIIDDYQTGLRYMVTHYYELLILTYKYRNPAKAWLNMVYPYQIPDYQGCMNCKVNKRFKSDWDHVKHRVLTSLKEAKMQSKIDNLLITALGPGGALAPLSYIDIRREELFWKISMNTYGPPRVGNMAWSIFISILSEGENTRYVVKNDPIIIMPRCATFFCEYGQSGDKLLCDHQTEQCVCFKKKAGADGAVTDDSDRDSDSDEVQVAGNLARDIWRAAPGGQVGSIIQQINAYHKIFNYTVIYK